MQIRVWSLPSSWQQLHSVIPRCICHDACCAWVFVALQGIKFYDPEIVENTPEAVEYKGLQNVMQVVAEQLGYEQGKVSESRVRLGTPTL